ncbi:MAG: Acetyltransferase [Candidatus Moranbacteria bacterium GW2011_GWE1_49_15]|nr:MAG: Acetyltransferase [Candidatus Moranbacteria bacterium GW2011_GWE2_47_10]KKW06534.1 MAG: Acetyltransferase [Candidatus Moranbacteria bacterium GW2011_GWE1_49_15]HBP01216.1 GNAT family N-acetyltransferase [Candidatus Moranbacteria bacterium]
MEIIKTKRFVLRTPKMSDAKDVAKNINNKNVSRNLSSAVSFPYVPKDAKQYIGKVLKELKEERPSSFILYIEIEGEVVGSIGAHHIEQGHKAEMGFWLAEQHWGKGIMPEAVEAFMKHVFKKFKLKRIFAKAYAHNKGSMRVMEKVGMEFEGIEKKGALKDGKYLDCYVYAKVK